MSTTIKVTCISAQLTRDTEMFSNMDPYVVIMCGSEKRKTRTHQEGGKRPLWNDSFTFANPKTQQIKFSVWDEDNLSDDLVGQGVLDITKFIKSPNVPVKEYISLTYQNKPAGKLYVEITYTTNQTNFNGQNSNNTAWNNTTNNNGWGTGNNNNSWGNTNNTNGWGQNNNNWANTNNNGWGNQNTNNLPNQNNNNTLNTQNNNQWNPQNNQNWAQNPQQNQNQNPQKNPYQQPNLEKKGSNNNVNPYGYTSTDDNTNPYPSLNDSKPNNVNGNPLELVMGARLLGQQFVPPQQQPQNPNVMNILNMAANGGTQNNQGWNQSPQQPNQWSQPQNNGWGNQPQNNGWGNQPQNNGWQKNNGWGNGW